ncbi:MAG: hypothetical protein EOO05_01110 [Chitinophagaceae bacterium]|nr:MAG: hypothetical protein EOO05_01110 [Chitinophagaceae bacterium]
MKDSISIAKHLVHQDKIDDIQQSLEIMEQKLDMEILGKQTTIERQETEIQRLHLLVEEKNRIVLDTNTKLAECMRNGEGNRQLINKLLGDLDRLAQDIEWYKRTYEKRSLLGTIRQKLFKK